MANLLRSTSVYDSPLFQVDADQASWQTFAVIVQVRILCSDEVVSLLASA